MQLDQAKIRFMGKMISAAQRQNASIDHREGKGFVDAIYQEWLETHQPLELAPDWLDRRMEREFCSLSNPPIWVEDEPSWPFLDGMPMIFLSQTSVDQNAFSLARLSPGETIYLFGARQAVNGGFKMIYRTVSQYAA